MARRSPETSAHSGFCSCPSPWLPLGLRPRERACAFDQDVGWAGRAGAEGLAIVLRCAAGPGPLAAVRTASPLLTCVGDVLAAPASALCGWTGVNSLSLFFLSLLGATASALFHTGTRDGRSPLIPHPHRLASRLPTGSEYCVLRRLTNCGKLCV